MLATIVITGEAGLVIALGVIFPEGIDAGIKGIATPVLTGSPKELSNGFMVSPLS